MAVRSDVPRNSEEWRSFLQWRVAGFGRILGAFVLGFYVLANAAGMLHPLARARDWVSQVLDFGLVKELGTDSASTTEASLTGTPLYLAPESVTAPDTVDGRSDLYAVGAVTFWLLTGTHVFDGKTIVEVCSHHLHTKPDSPSARLGASVPSDLEDVVLRCLEKDPAKRYPNADALARALDACDAAEEWSDALAAQWWKTHRAEANAARPKLTRPSRTPGPIAVDLEGRAGLGTTSAPDTEGEEPA